jgi:hypothetical protein
VGRWEECVKGRGRVSEMDWEIRDWKGG